MTNARLEELRTKYQENPRRYFAPYANELRKVGETDQAITICRTHLSGQPGHVSGHIVLAQALHEAGEHREARDVFAAALELDPENLIALRTMGDIAYAGGDFSGARHWYERLLDADPRNQEIATLLVDLRGSEATFRAASPDDEGAPAERPAPSAEAAPHYAPEQPAEAAPPVESYGPPPVLVYGPPDVATVPLTQDDAGEARPEGPAVEPGLEAGAPAQASEPAAPEPVAAFDHHQIEVDSMPPAAPWPEHVPEQVVPEMQFDPAQHGSDPSPGEPAVDAAAEVLHGEAPQAPESKDQPGSTWLLAGSLGAAEAAVDRLPAADPLLADGPGLAGHPGGELAAPDAVAESEAETLLFDSFEVDVPPPPPPPSLSFDSSGWELTEPQSRPEPAGADGAAQSERPEAQSGRDETEGAPTEPFVETQAGAPTWDDAGGGEVPPPIQADSHRETDADGMALPEGEVEPATWRSETPAASIPEPSGRSGEEVDPPRARFAENGFDGFTADQPDWPQHAAAFSDPEAAPDAWFPGEDVTDASDGDVGAEAAEGAEPWARDSRDWFAPAADESQDWFASGDSEEVRPEVPAEDLFMAPDLSTMGVAGEAGAPAAGGVFAGGDEAADSLPGEDQPAAWAEGSAAAGPVGMERGDAHLASDASAPEAGEGEVYQYPAEASAGMGHGVTPQAALGEERESQRQAPLAPSGGVAPRRGESGAFEAVSPAPFVTETLAELYLQQGFRDEALRIYRQLAERDPGNAALAGRIREIEQGLPAAGGEEPPPSGGAAHRSVRTFFSGIARRTPTATAAEARLARAAREAEAPAPGGTGSGSEPPFAAAASALANMFAASKPAAVDEQAASTLAGAYSEQQTGRPARAADRELSLDHLFRDVPPGGAAGGSAAGLDAFYATREPSGPAARPDEAAGAPHEGESDIRQFTAWLEGLRKK